MSSASNSFSVRGDSISESPLLQRPEQETMALLTQSLRGIEVGEQALAIPQASFLHHVQRLAARLPEHRHAVNLCDNRYLFLVSFCAVLVRGGTNLLPPNKNTITQRNMRDRYEECVLLHDSCVELADEITDFDVSTLDWGLDDEPSPVPIIKSDHLAAISFTSGSTGESKPNLKYWQTLVESSAINANHMLVNSDVHHCHVATVPGQHMWGFETSVLLPMFANVSLVDARPFYPHDIVKVIDSVSSPCTLISAPLHLKAFSGTLDATEMQTKLSSILCATAPLQQGLAKCLEHQTGAELREVYGCSEVGSMAVRRTAQSAYWSTFNGLDFSLAEDHKVTVSAPHLPKKIQLEDTLNFVDTKTFSLSGRCSDQVKVAGKRGSLAEVNDVLHRFSGVLDGVVLFPEQNRAVPRLVAIVCLADGTTKAQLREHMREHLDPAFVPRPIYQVTSLPREENGKLSRAKALDLYLQLAAAV